MLYSLCFVLIAIGLYGVFVKKNVVKMLLGLMIMEYGVNLLLILSGYHHKGIAPIIDKTRISAQYLASIVDPMPQTMVIASIMIGLGLLVLLVAICIRLYERFGTFDISEMRRLKG
jgi:multicomponent Na+:H+ antiporter subunit C